MKAGETVHVEVRDWIGLNTRAVFKKGKHRVGLLFMAEKKLGNKNFVERAPESVVEDNRTRLSDAKERLGRLSAALARLESAP